MTFRSFFYTALATILWPVISQAADWDLDQLMQTLAQTRSGHVRFVETKTIAILDKPVESSGELLYTAPDHLEKRTLKPKPETMVLDQGLLQVERGRQKHSLRMQDYPELAAFIDSIRGTLAGDRQALERNFRLSLEGNRQNWNLRLVPANDKMLAVIKRIDIAGEQELVKRIDISQADGDRSSMRIEPLAEEAAAP
jgi:hypothetical protein